MSGKGCGFTHPKRCNKFMDLGRYGCKSDDICKNFHPRVCNDSNRHMQCTKKKCDWLHIRKTRKPLEHQQDVATAPSRQENTNLRNPQQHSNSNHVGQSRGVQQPCVHDGHFQNCAQRFPPATPTENYSSYVEQDNRPSCNGGRPVSDACESSSVAVNGNQHNSAKQSQTTTTLHF